MSEIRRFKRLAVAFLIAGLGVACDSVGSSGTVKFDRVEVYYRDFSTLTPISYSATDLEKRATIKLNLTDHESVEKLANALDIPCHNVDDVSEQRMDVYLLVKEFNGDDVVTWKASPFHFYSSSQHRVCKLDSVSRSNLERLVESLAQS